MDSPVKNSLSGNQLKTIAILAMTFDHLIWAIFPGCRMAWYVWALHIVGRLTAPIMWFFLAEGSFHTRNPRKYIGRLFLFALVSHFAYDFAFGIPVLPLSTGAFNQTSVMWSLALGALLIYLAGDDRLPGWKGLGVTLLLCLAAFPSDWSSVAVMAPFFLYHHRGNFKKQAWDLVVWSGIYALVYCLFLNWAYGLLQMATVLSIPLLKRYNGQRGSWKGMKWFFYLYYPAHLAAIGLLRLVLHGNIPIIF